MTEHIHTFARLWDPLEINVLLEKKSILNKYDKLEKGWKMVMKNEIMPVLVQEIITITIIGHQKEKMKC